jgi:SPP1 family predicted phage head-tail adaptor
MKNKTPEWSAGDFRSVLDLQVEDRTSDNAGGFNHSFRSIGKVFANAMQSSGSEQFSDSIGARLLSFNGYTFTTWYRADIETVKRVIFDGKIFNIRSTFNIDDRRKFVSFYAECGVEV